MKIVLVLVALFALCAAVPPPRRTGGVFVDPRFPHAPEGSGFGPVGRWRANLPMNSKPWLHGYGPRPPYRPHHRAPTQDYSEPTTHTEKDASADHGYKAPEGPAHNVVSKESHAHGPHPSALKKRPTSGKSSQYGPRQLARKAPTNPPRRHGDSKLIYVLIPYCPEESFGENVFSRLLPRYGMPPQYEPLSYETVDIEEPQYGPVTSYSYEEPLHVQDDYSYGINDLSTNLHYRPAPVSTKHSRKPAPESDSVSKPRSNPSYQPASHSTQELSFVEPVDFSKTEQHYETKPSQYVPPRVSLPVNTPVASDAYLPDNLEYSIPGLEEFAPETYAPPTDTKNLAREEPQAYQPTYSAHSK